jgi:hypothetical protein
VRKIHSMHFLLLSAVLFASSASFGQTYQNLVPPAGFATSAGEPSIGVNWNTGKILFEAVLETDRVTINGSTVTWENVSSPETSVVSLDPILFTDHTTGRTLVSQLAGACSLSSFTDNDGTSYTPAVGCGVPAGIDHQTIGGGPFAPSLIPQLPPPVGYQHAIYYCSQGVIDASCAISLNGGLTYGPAVPIYTLADCGGLHGHIKVGPDGTAYVPNKNCGSGNAAVVSPAITVLPGQCMPFPAARLAIAIHLSRWGQTTPCISAGTAATAIPWWRFLTTTALPGPTSPMLEPRSEFRTSPSLPWLQAMAAAPLLLF